MSCYYCDKISSGDLEYKADTVLVHLPAGEAGRMIET